MQSLLDPGTVLDGFLVQERIHSGGMAVIYRVSRSDLEFPAIMKVPRLGHGEPASSVISFEVEQTVMAVLKGPHVPRFVAAGDMAEQPFLVMEYVEGTLLEDRMEGEPAHPTELARIGVALAAALRSIHVQHAIHLDLKPGNVILRPSGDAVLIDFGLAHHGHFPDLLAEEWRRPIGSAPYIAPEQVLGVRHDPRSDIFALGAILYQLATGRLPFGSPKSASALRKRLWRDPVPPRALQADFPEWLQEVILRCLEPDPGNRCATAAQVTFDLSHPEEVAVTERGRRARRSGFPTVFRRWFRAAGYEPSPPEALSAFVSEAPIVLAAVATTHTNEAIFQALRDAVTRALDRDGQTRLACVSVVPTSPEVGGSKPDETSTSQQIKHRVLLRHWSEPLGLPPERVSFHVIESNDPAGALLEYARTNHVSHILIGAPPPRVALKGTLGVVAVGEGTAEPLPLLRLLGTVSMRVAAAAPCTVTVVRAPEG